MDYVYIDNDTALEHAIARCLEASVVAVDTEFARFNTYYPMVGLLQLGIGSENYLIDPLAITDLSGLKTLFLQPQTLKVVHAGSEDMEVFQHWLGCLPTPLLDTQIAAAMLGIGYSMSYQKLVAHCLALEIPKGETRSDWLARPLTRSQCDYAALDVIHLFTLFFELEKELRRLHRFDWVLTESNRLTEALPTLIEPEHAYLKLKGLSQLTPRQLEYLRLLAAFRERQAQFKNVPRNRVLETEELIALAMHEVHSANDLKASQLISSRSLRRYSDAIVEIGLQANAADEADLPRRVVGDSTPVNKKKLDRLRRVVADQSKAYGIAPELLSRRRDLEAIIKSDNQGRAELPASMQGWREAVVGDPLLAEMNR